MDILQGMPCKVETVADSKRKGIGFVIRLLRSVRRAGSCCGLYRSYQDAKSTGTVCEDVPASVEKTLAILYQPLLAVSATPWSCTSDNRAHDIGIMETALKHIQILTYIFQIQGGDRSVVLNDEISKLFVQCLRVSEEVMTGRCMGQWLTTMDSLLESDALYAVRSLHPLSPSDILTRFWTLLLSRLYSKVYFPFSKSIQKRQARMQKSELPFPR